MHVNGKNLENNNLDVNSVVQSQKLGSDNHHDVSVNSRNTPRVVIGEILADTDVGDVAIEQPWEAMLMTKR